MSPRDNPTKDLQYRFRTLATSFLVLFCAVSLLAPSTVKASFYEKIIKFFDFSKKETIHDTPSADLALLGVRDSIEIEDRETFINDEAVAAVDSGPLRLSNEPKVYIPEADTISIYTVHDGDTLNSIAGLFNVSVNTILWANDIPTKKVKPGDVLTILPVSGIEVETRKGDTLETLAKKYSADAEDIALYNGFALDKKFEAGEKVLIPDGEIQEEVQNKNIDKADKKSNKKDTKKESVKQKVTKTVKKITKNLSSAGYFVRPISGGVRTTGLHGHNAVDLAAPVGTPIYAAAGGTVITVKTGGYNGGYGNYVVVSHPNGTQTLYAHTSANYVQIGQQVSQGEQIAAVGSTGKSTGPHVHFEVRGGVNPF